MPVGDQGARAGAPDARRISAWVRGVATAIALAGSLAALSLLLLPLLLVLLMVLFETTAHGVLALLSLLLGWMGRFTPDGYGPGGGGFDPAGIAVGALLRAIPVVGGLAPLLAGRDPRQWRLALLGWAVAAACDGRAVAIVLVPAMAGAAICALPRDARPGTGRDAGTDGP